MIKQLKLEDLIREKVSLGQPDSRGFYSLKCQCCNDYKVRAGFKFDNGTIGYNCFNCGVAARFTECSGEISKKFRSILNAFGVEDSEISSVINTAFFIEKKEEKKITLASLTKVDTSTPTLQLPPKSFRLGGSLEFTEYQEKLINYLVDRKIDILKYPFFFSLDDRMIDRVIIPFYRHNKIIFWQGRSVNADSRKRYDNAIAPRGAVMFNMDKLNVHSPLPLFVTEGVFDAMMFDGIAILGSKLNSAKIELLNKTHRRLIFVIDKDDNGRHLAEEVLARGWEIAFVPSGASDLNESVRRFGFAWTAYELMKSIPKNPDAANLTINLNCK